MSDFIDQDLIDGDVSYHEQLRAKIPSEVADASTEIERLKQQQAELEARKQALAEQRRKIEDLEKNRRVLIEKLRRSSVVVVREGEQASRAAALCSEVSNRFAALHAEIELLDPSQWSQEEYDARLTDALALVDSAASEYRKAVDSIDALVASHNGSFASLAASGISETSGEGRGNVSLFRWFIAGIAFALPLVIAIAIVIAIVLLRQ